MTLASPLYLSRKKNNPHCGPLGTPRTACERLVIDSTPLCLCLRTLTSEVIHLFCWLRRAQLSNWPRQRKHVTRRSLRNLHNVTLPKLGSFLCAAADTVYPVWLIETRQPTGILSFAKFISASCFCVSLSTHFCDISRRWATGIERGEMSPCFFCFSSASSQDFFFLSRRLLLSPFSFCATTLVTGNPSDLGSFEHVAHSDLAAANKPGWVLLFILFLPLSFRMYAECFRLCHGRIRCCLLSIGKWGRHLPRALVPRVYRSAYEWSQCICMEYQFGYRETYRN